MHFLLPHSFCSYAAAGVWSFSCQGFFRREEYQCWMWWWHTLGSVSSGYSVSISVTINKYLIVSISVMCLMKFKTSFLVLNVLLYCGHAQGNHTIFILFCSLNMTPHVSLVQTASFYVFFLSMYSSFHSWILCWCLDSLLTIKSNWSTLFTGESVTLVCDMRYGEDTDWYYTVMKDHHHFCPSSSKKSCTIQPLATGDSGEYKCVGHHKRIRDFSKESNTVSLTVSGKRSKLNDV